MNKPQSTSRRERILRAVAMTLALSMLQQIAAPTLAFALTSGPGQPEFASFEPVGTSDMVDLYSGDFNYNIPLLSVPGPNGGYPINLAYHSGVGVDEEASWVGLGWNVNVGAINRQLRGLPDDFKGDQITHKSYIKPNWTTAVNLFAQKKELFGTPQNGPSASPAVTGQIYYNSYRGLGYRIMSQRLSLEKVKSLGLNLSYDSQGGLGVEVDLTAGSEFANQYHMATLGAGYNSRQGLQEASFTTSTIDESKSAVKAGQSQISFGTQFNVPGVQLPMRTNTIPFSAYLNGISGVTPLPGNFSSPFQQSITGFYSESMVDNGGVVQSNGYGYLHTASAGSATDMRDFQRENIPYSKRVPNLAPSSFTYDQFMQSGQGTGAQFRAYSNAVGVLADREQTNNDYTTPLNLEFGSNGSPTPVHFGAGFSLGVGTNTSGGWQSLGIQNDVQFGTVFDFKGNGNPEYQSSPFAVIGEMTGILDSEDQLKLWGGDKPVRAGLIKNSDASYFDRQFEAKNQFLDKNQNTVINNGNSTHKYRTQNRQRRGTNVETLNETQAQAYGITKNIGYTLSGNTLINASKTYYGGTRANHISEMTSVQADGMRYTYGLPAYNNRQIDGSFTTGLAGNHNSKTVPVPYLPGSPWSVNNAGVYDEYSQQTEMQHYVHSWLLTSVCSPDYIDLTQNGPSDDDYGYWVRFNYNKTSSAYNWHVPYSGANYFDGKKGDPTDNKASYSCGNREQYYLNSIETKTHIAIFYTSKREDGVAAAANINGGLPSSITDNDRLYRLDSVKLFSKTEYYTDPANRVLKPNPVAIKTVHFRYTYELCGKGTGTYYNQFVTNNTGVMVAEDGTVTTNASLNVNANKGKLTLRKVFFTYQQNERGELSPYNFTYHSGLLNTTAASGTNENPYYDPTSVDRWGNFKDISTYTTSGNNYPYVDNPFVDQKSSQTGNPQSPPVAPWNLRQLELPSGALIKVQYENDDYGYVEDQPAMRMFDIVSLGDTITTSSSYNISDNDLRASSTVVTDKAETANELLHGAYRVYFRMEDVQSASLTPTQQRDYIIEKYLNRGNLKKLYFNAMMDLKNSGSQIEIDNVKGYAEIEYNNVNNSTPAIGMRKSNSSSSNFDLGFITLKGVPVQSATILNTSVGLPPIPKVSPFIHAALQHLHFNRSELVYNAIPYSTTVGAQITNLINATVSSSTDITQMIAGFNAWAYAKGFGKDMYLNGKSYIRLYEPDGIKLGGGSRVKRITVNDNWVNNTADTYEYGLDYDYTISENGRTISSGVCYEPQIGGDESALRQPIEYVNSAPLRSDETLFLEKPLMESYYPGASVGYRKVTVRSIAPEKADLGDDQTANNSNILKYNAAPISVYEFYTPKEFPVWFDQTDMTADPSIVRVALIPGIYTGFAKRKARSQGYSIVLNDMAGKMRAVEQRTRPTATNPAGTLITRQEYIYNTEKPFSDLYPNYLSSKVQVLTGNGTYQTASLGQTHDIIIDMKEDRSKMVSGGLEANIDVNGSVPVPTFFPQANVRDFSMRTVVVNKVIYRSGIVKAVIATHESSTIRTDNIAFDPETGQALITKTTNEFKDPVYSFSYPGHWYYDALKGGYLNHDVVVDNIDASGGLLSLMTASANGRVNIGSSYLAAGKATKDYFTPGDEVYVLPGGGRYHVMKVGPGFIDLVTLSGTHIPAGTQLSSIRVIRSGYDNLQSVSAGSLAMRTINGIQQFNPQTMTALITNTPYTIPTSQNILSASAVEFVDIMQLFCTSGCETGGNIGSSSIADPYAVGLRGNWRPYRSYAFVTDRNQNDNVRQDGTYTAFAPFNWSNPSLADSRWTSAATITKYSPYGFELENKDATGNYTSALYGYNNSLNTAVAANAQYKEIAFDGFEDYIGSTACAMQNRHWGVTNTTNISNTYAHSGTRSLKVANGQSVQITSNVGTDNCEQQREQERLPQGGNPSDPTAQYVLDDCDCIGNFKPTAGKKYLLSMWVKQTAVGSVGYVPNTLAQFTSPGLTVSTNMGGVTVTAEPSSPVIEGWQRVLYSFTVPVGATSITFAFTNNSGNASDDYFDDIRIQPYDANMTTYVYDPVTYRLVAQLDANNFATFFIYNEQGMLEKTRVETTDGIKTVKEGRSNSDKH